MRMPPLSAMLADGRCSFLIPLRQIDCSGEAPRIGALGNAGQMRTPTPQYAQTPARSQASLHHEENIAIAQREKCPGVSAKLVSNSKHQSMEIFCPFIFSLINLKCAAVEAAGEFAFCIPLRH
jgi:hypothetical protein